MKFFKNPAIIAVFILTLIYACYTPDSEEDKTNEVEVKNEEPVFNSQKAELYGADEYGMKKYVMAFLKRGPNKDLDSLKKVELQTAHLENINRLAKEGKLVLAGPFFDDGDLRGIYIFNVQSIKEAEDLTNTDPAVKAGTLIMELKEWYGSAALTDINDIHKTLMKKSITEE